MVNIMPLHFAFIGTCNISQTGNVVSLLTIKPGLGTEITSLIMRGENALPVRNSGSARRMTIFLSELSQCSAIPHQEGLEAIETLTIIARHQPKAPPFR